MALKYHFHDCSLYYGLDYYEKALLLCNQFKPSEIRIVYQGIWTDAGNDWRSLKLGKLKSMRALAPELAKACVDIVNARADLATSARRVPRNIVVKQERVDDVQP